MWKHRLSNKDPDALTGDCSHCGPGVSLKRKSPGRLRCREAILEQERDRYHRNPQYKYLKYDRARSYGLTDAELAQMELRQQNRCANPGCRTDVPGGPHNVLKIDHDHITGEIRGLLCNKCNMALGLLGDGRHNDRICGLYEYASGPLTFDAGASAGLL